MSPAAIRWLLRALALAALLAAAWWAVVAPRLALSDERAAHAATKAANSAVLASLAEKTKAAAEKARVASLAARRATAAADTRLQEKTDEAKRLGADLARALRAGDRQLQDWWACPVSGAAAGDAAADRAEADAARRADSTGRIAEAVAADAALIDWLWTRWQADRQAVIDGGCAVVAP